MLTAAPTATVLHLGCGRREHVEGVVTLDADARVNPDLVCTLGEDRIPLADDSVDVAVANHVLEHIGVQGETVRWFQFWEDLYRVLKPGALFTFESPLYSSVWAWADPSHTRALSPESFVFFNQDAYRLPGSSISPFRVRCDFTPVGNIAYVGDDRGGSHFGGTLRARKPLRPWWES